MVFSICAVGTVSPARNVFSTAFRREEIAAIAMTTVIEKKKKKKKIEKLCYTHEHAHVRTLVYYTQEQAEQCTLTNPCCQ